MATMVQTAWPYRKFVQVIVFRHTPSGFRLGANMKVLFSFLTEHSKFERIGDPHSDVLLWRDPFARTVSTFFDKCRQAINPELVQDCQKVLLDELAAEDVTALRDLSFHDFVMILPRVRDRDSHFRPQSHGLTRASFSRIADVDHDLGTLGRHLDIDFSIRVNSTEHAEPSRYFDDATRALVQDLYADDLSLKRRARRIRRLRNHWSGRPIEARPPIPPSSSRTTHNSSHVSDPGQ